MPATVTNDPPGRIGPVGAGWTIQLDAIPNNPLQSSPSTGVAGFTAVSTAESHLTMNNNSVFDFIDEEFENDVADVSVDGTSWESLSGSEGYGDNGYGEGPYSGGVGGGYGTGLYNSGNYGAGNGSGFVDVIRHYPAPAKPIITASVTGVIDAVSLSGETGTFSQGTQFTQFTRADVKIPTASSGSPLAALLLAWQLAGKYPCAYTDRTGIYWSLRGHDAGFDYENNCVVPIDNSAHKILVNNTVYRQWDVTKSYASTKWVVHGDDLWSVAGVGSSLDLTPGVRNIITGSTMLDDTSTPFTFSLGSSLTNWGLGPKSSNEDYGKWFNISITRTGASLTGGYYSGGGALTVNKSAQLTGIDPDAPIQFAISFSFQSAKVLTLSVYISNFPDADGVAPTPVVLTSGLLTTGHDLSCAPWTHTGYLQDLYVTTVDRVTGNSTANYLGDYVDWGLYPFCDLDDLGISGGPILPFSGTLWDYLTQVCIARQIDLRLVGGRFALSAMSENGPVANDWTPVSAPTFSIDDSTTASSVEIDANIVKFSKSPVIYDGQKDTATYSVTPGTTSSFTVTTTSVNALVYNPTPVDSFDDYLHGTHPYGAYIISGPDNLPILSAEWISYGGSLSVAQTDLNTLTITVVCPMIPLGTSNDASNYTIGVSDGSTTYNLLKLVSVAGGQSVAKNLTFQTGASYVGSNSSGSSVQNVAATDQQSISNLAAWAVAEASGPHLTLSGEFPLDDLRNWTTGSDFGVVPGSTIIYRNVQWRILTATMSSLGVSFTAEPYTLYSSQAFGINWDGRDVDDYIAFWEGKTYDDMATMVLSGPVYDWGSDGAVTKFTLYPSAGESLILDNGLDPSTTLLPSVDLDPDAPSAVLSGSIFPGSTDYPGNTDYPMLANSLLVATWPSAGEQFPGSEEE